jgi:rod shape-determining protein MreB
VRIGGVKFDMAISEYVRRKYGLAVGERTAEDIKINIGSAMYLPDKLTMEVKGRDMITGLPKVVEVSSDDVTTAIQHELDGIVATVKDVLNKTPPELSADVMDKGIMMSGGSSQLRNLDTLIAEATGVPTFVAEDPQMCVAKGTGIALENLEAYKRSIFTS